MRYIVTAMHKDKLDGATVRDDRSSVGMYECIGLQEVAAATMRKNYLDIGTFFFDNKELAMTFAKYFARNRPGWDIYVAEVQNIVCTEVPETIIKTVNEKGVLPQ